MQLSTRTFILFGIISLLLAAGVVYIVNKNNRIEPLRLPPPDSGKDTQTAINTQV